MKKRKVGAKAKAALEDVEMRILAAEGRRSIRSRVETVKRVARKALKAGAVAGTIAAATVVMRERKKRKRLGA